MRLVDFSIALGKACRIADELRALPIEDIRETLLLAPGSASPSDVSKLILLTDALDVCAAKLRRLDGASAPTAGPSAQDDAGAVTVRDGAATTTIDVTSTTIPATLRAAGRFFLSGDRSWFNETCPAAGRGRHCWHRGMATYTSLPSQHDETCCFCGETIRVQDPAIPLSGYRSAPKDHGPHDPAKGTIMFNAPPTSGDPARTVAGQEAEQ